MTKIGDTPVKLQFGIEYSVVQQDTFGQVAQIKLNIIPVIKSLVKEPYQLNKWGQPGLEAILGRIFFLKKV
jgi:hypothetical protein